MSLTERPVQPTTPDVFAKLKERLYEGKNPQPNPNSSSKSKPINNIFDHSDVNSNNNINNNFNNNFNNNNFNNNNQNNQNKSTPVKASHNVLEAKNAGLAVFQANADRKGTPQCFTDFKMKISEDNNNNKMIEKIAKELNNDNGMNNNNNKNNNNKNVPISVVFAQSEPASVSELAKKVVADVNYEKMGKKSEKGNSEKRSSFGLAEFTQGTGAASKTNVGARYYYFFFKKKN